MSSQKKILVILAHPSPEKSEINLPIFRAAKNLPYVTAVDLYYEYPNYRMDVNKEQRQLIEHDIIIFLFPFYWYSTPSMLKEWQDNVLQYGFAYGLEGVALRGKLFFCAISTVSGQQAFQYDGYNHFTVRELLQPLEQMASLTGMIYLPPFVLFGARTALQEHRLQPHIQTWKRLLDLLSIDSEYFSVTSHLALLNDCLLLHAEQKP